MRRLTQVTEQLVRPVIPEALPARPSPFPVPMPALPTRVFPSVPIDAPELLLWMAFPARCGRVTAQHLLHAIGWAPGHRLDIQLCHGMLVITSAQDDRNQVGSRGELPLPARPTAVGGSTCTK